MRWRILEDGHKTYVDAQGKIVGRVVEQEGNGHAAYHITPDRTKRTPGATKRELLGHFVEENAAKRAVERRVDQQ